MTSGRLFTFNGSSSGSWRVRSQVAYLGQPIATVACVSVHSGATAAPADGWSFRGITSNDRYVARTEKRELAERQEGLGRPEATYAALIPIRKSAAWWAMTQDERRAVFEEQSKHMRIGMKYLPPIARRLHHCRDLGEPEAFDFLTWFEYHPTHESAFDELLMELRATPEWQYVDHEIDIRLVNIGSSNA